MNHHRTFFPYIGLVISLSWAGYLLFQYVTEKVRNVKQAQYIFGFMAIVLISGHAYGTYQRNIIWDNDESLWLDVTQKSPNNGRGQMNYGLTQMRKGKYQEAIEYFEIARNTTYGNHPYLFINLGIAKNALGLKKEAENYFRTAVQKGPGYPDCHFYYGKWLLENGRNSEAIPKLQRAVELSPAHSYAQQLLENATMNAGQRLKKAEENVKNNPSAENYLSLSLDYYNIGLYLECIAACEKALKLKPNYAEAYNNICSAYNKLKQWDKAVEACEAALNAKPNYQLAKGNLNWAKRHQ